MAAKERLRPSLAPGNVEKTMAAPVTVIIAYDMKFYDKLPRLFPHYPAMRDMFVNNPQLIQETALRNSTLQGAYMILAARALGLSPFPRVMSKTPGVWSKYQSKATTERTAVQIPAMLPS